ncbi:hypothetical protein BH11PSE9_BH11PSE9_05720 [soil metagenome]
MPTQTAPAATPSQPVDLVTADLALIFSLADAAKQMAERASQENDPNVRAALRNQAKVANEQAGLLLARGAVTLFNGVPADAAAQIAEAVDGVSEVIASIQKAKKAISFVTSLVGVAGAVLLGDWAGVAKAITALTAKKAAGAA